MTNFTTRLDAIDATTIELRELTNKLRDLKSRHRRLRTKLDNMNTGLVSDYKAKLKKECDALN